MAAPAATRVVSHTRKVPTMRPPTARPNAPSRAQTATPTLTGRLSPADSLASSRVRTPKRKLPADFVEPTAGGAAEETNINVVVRCRNRNDREVKENSGVVISTDGRCGNKVELSMGPSALSNKTYQFDKVYSQAADQKLIFDDVVAPILDEVLNGFNCTLFAYGQTGTGKTYTMSGDISDTVPIPDAAGIIPRALHHLFDKLSEDEPEKTECSVKCSFIELYNEELRDLLAVDDTTKLKIFDEANKNGRTTTLVQGMEERYIKTATKGIALLRDGSHKRQVAATKCNDLSSRSHTVFTITVYMKRVSDSGEDFVSSGKLNLVDLAGSENIGRSGAENKRAVEAGLINKSLLTLGRVINALVDRGSHIPYRESKLTRLLQDSLGGRTKTCIIATLSPAKSNLEETISTLDYAFRAKNIRNKPQINQMVSKKTLLKEFTAEIEKLKSELIATRARNGVYLTAEAYEELATESESRRILSEEQKDKLEMMESNLKNKMQELSALTTSFISLKKDSEQVKTSLENAKTVLEKTEIVLQQTRRSLAEEAQLRRAHEETEKKLHEVGGDLLSNLETTTDHVGRLHSKLRRRSDLQSLNRSRWTASQSRVTAATLTVEERLEMLRDQQESMMSALSSRMQSFVTDELHELQSSQTFLQGKASAFETSRSVVEAQTGQAREDMNVVLEEISTLRDDVKVKVGAGLDDLSAAAQRISAGIATELGGFHSQLEESYVSLGREFKTLFEDLIKKMNEQQAEVQKLRDQIAEANGTFVVAGQLSQVELEAAITLERETAAREREALLTQITSLVQTSATTQDARLSSYVESAAKRIKTSKDRYEVAQQSYRDGMDTWNANSQSLIDASVSARESIKNRLKTDWNSADQRTGEIVQTANAVHGETVRIVDDQMAQMDSQLVALDEIVSRVRQRNEQHHEAHTSSLEQLATDVQESYRSIGEHFDTSYLRTQNLDVEMREHASELLETLPSLTAESEIREPLRTLREDVTAAKLEEYSATGETPARTQYNYPTVLPRTESHDALLDRMRGTSTGQTKSHAPRSPTKSPFKRSPSKPLRRSPTKFSVSSPTKASNTSVFTDTPPPLLHLGRPASAPLVPTTRSLLASNMHNSSASTMMPPPPSLRERDINLATAPTLDRPAAAVPLGHASLDTGTGKSDDGIAVDKISPQILAVKKHPLSMSVSAVPTDEKKPAKRATRLTVAGLAAACVAAETMGREKENVVNLSASVGLGTGRRLRSRGSD